MRLLFKVLVLALLCAALPAAADVYKWVDNEGKIHYSDTPPAKGAAKTLDLPNIGTETKPAESPAAELKPREAPAPVQAAAPPAPAVAAPAAVRGMPFDVYIMLRTGMNEGELIQRAGPPDYESFEGSVGNAVVTGRRGRVQSFNNLELRRLYYYPTSSDPFTTVVTLTGGMISDLQRTRKF